MISNADTNFNTKTWRPPCVSTNICARAGCHLTDRPGRPLKRSCGCKPSRLLLGRGRLQHQANQSGVANLARVRGARRSRSCSATLQIIETAADPNLGLELGDAVRSRADATLRRDLSAAISPRPAAAMVAYSGSSRAAACGRAPNGHRDDAHKIARQQDAG